MGTSAPGLGSIEASAKLPKEPAIRGFANIVGRTLVLYLGRILILLGLAAVWSAIVRLGFVDKLFVSSPESVTMFLYENFWRELVPNTLATLFATLIAFSLSGV